MSRIWPARVAALCAVLAITTVAVVWRHRSMMNSHSNSVEADSLIVTHSEVPPDTDAPTIPNIELPSDEPPDYVFLGTGLRELYVAPYGAFAGCNFELSAGRFRCHSFSDVMDYPGSPAKPARGTYTTEGKRIVFKFNNSTHVMVGEKREIDGVTVLLSPRAIENDLRGGHPTTSVHGEVWVLRPKVLPMEPQIWWGYLLKEHPKFAEWLHPGFNHRR